MLSAFNEQRDLVIAWDSNRDQGPFSCPECKRGVTLKKGQFIIHHFAHTSGSNCSYGTGESYEHWRAKYEIYHALLTHPHVSELRVELPLGPVRPDIAFRWIDEVMVSVELQRSTLPPADAARRTSYYEEKGIAVLWVSLPQDRFWTGARCSTRLWERFLHELYSDKIFCWHGGSQRAWIPIYCELNTGSDTTGKPEPGIIKRSSTFPNARGYRIISMRYRSPT